MPPRTNIDHSNQTKSADSAVDRKEKDAKNVFLSSFSELAFMSQHLPLKSERSRWKVKRIQERKNPFRDEISFVLILRWKESSGKAKGGRAGKPLAVLREAFTFYCYCSLRHGCIVLISDHKVAVTRSHSFYTPPRSGIAKGDVKLCH
jgi:hypothetical protein